MKALNMIDVHRKYKGLWVALKEPNSNVVVAFGKTLREAMETANKKGYKLPVMMQVPKRMLPIIGGYLVQ